MKYIFSKNGLASVKKLPNNIHLRVIRKLDYFFGQTDPIHFAKRLTNYSCGEYRFRIGDYRVTFDIQNDIVVILKVQHRKEVYKNK